MRTVIVLFNFFVGLFCIQAQNLACFNDVYVRLDDKGQLTVFALDVLEGENLNNDDYIIRLNDDETDASTIDLFEDDIGTHRYTIVEKSTQNMCWGNLILTDDNSVIPVAVCAQNLLVNLDVFNGLLVSDVNVGSYDDITPAEDLIITISRDPGIQLNPRDEGFEISKSIDFSVTEICTVVPAMMYVWDMDGLRSSCFTEIRVVDNLSLCDFGVADFNCPNDRVFYVDDNQGVNISALESIHGGSLMGSYQISIDDGEFADSYSFGIEDVGMHKFSVLSEEEIICSGLFSVEEICTTEPCPNQMGFGSYIVSEGEQVCFTASGITNSSIASLQTGIVWDETILQFLRVEETGSLTQISLNEGDIAKGELKLLWLVGLDDDPVVGEFGFDICFTVIGKSEEGTRIAFEDLEGFGVEVSSGIGTVIPMILNNGTVCIDTCPAIFSSDQTVKDDEIALYTNPFDSKNSVLLFNINGTEASKYENGTYGLPQSAIVNGDNTISISASQQSSALNGISTLDLVMTLQYVLGLEDLTPSQIIAADVDKSGDVSLTNDISHMNNLILGIETDIQGENWFFIPRDFIFDQSFNGFDFTNNYSSYVVNGSELDSEEGLTVDIYKYGDLNNNFALNRSDEMGLIDIDNEFVSAHSPAEIKITLSSENIVTFVGAQAALKLNDASFVDFEHDYGSSLSYHVVEDQIRFTWLSNEAIESIEFILKLDAKMDGLTADFISLDKNFRTEYITRDLQVFPIELKLNQMTSYAADINIPQAVIYPNPTFDAFTIEVDAKQLGKELHIYNTMGQLEYKTIIKKTVTQLSKQKLLSHGIKIVHIDGISSQKLLIHK